MLLGGTLAGPWVGGGSDPSTVDSAFGHARSGHSVGLVAGLLRRRRRAFPIALVALGAMVAYQLFRWWLTRSLPLGLLTAFDLAILWLIRAEWHHLRRGAGTDAASSAGSGSRPT